MKFFSFVIYLSVSVVIVLNLVQVVLTEKRGFILTSPKALKTGTLEHLTLTLFQIPDGGLITIRLLKAESDDVLSEAKVYAQSSHSTWVELAIPLVSDTKARLHVKGVFNLADGYQINSVKEVYLTPNSLITFIQTDKPIYKPGQTVRFRVFPVDVFLKPIDSKSIGDIWIENPTGIRVAQWKNVSFTNGLVQLELPLSGEPLLGDWLIHSEISGKSGQQSFKVDKYVLPRFEVTIIPPPFILANASTIFWKICARYTYGKRVDGILTVHITYKKYEWEKSSKYSRELPFIEIEEPVNIIENATSISEVTHNPLEIVFLEAKLGMNYYKPGLPYHGTVKVTTPNDIPVSHEPIQICCKGVCKTFISDKNGLIHFSIPPQPFSYNSEVMLEAKAINYRDEPYETWGMKIYQPHTTMILLPWYSPSNSFIQIQPSKVKFSCEKLEHVKIKYTTTDKSRIKFYHQIIARGLIVQQGSHWRTFNPAEDKSQEIDDTYIIDENTRLRNWISNETNTSYVGEFLLNFDSRSFMSPTSRLLIFYVRPDGETVADSQHFELHSCLNNKVKLKFRQGQQYPGTEATLHLEASSFSFCGITFVDKSINLISSDNRMTVENVFKHLNKFDSHEKFLPQHENNEYCDKKKLIKKPSTPINQNVPLDEDLRRKKRSLTPYKYSSTYADAMTAFEDARMVVLSDLTLETRPCVYMHFEDSPHDRTFFPFLRKSGTGNSLPSAIPLEMVIDNIVASPPSSTPKSASIIRSYFPETWLWQLQPVGEIGEVIFSHKLPDAITEWTGNAICINKQRGLGISDTTSIITFQPFFVSIILPYSVIRGEKVPIVTTIFNYLSDCLPVKLSLEATDQFKIIGSNTHKTCVCGDTSKTHRFMIQPKILGNITITVYGYSLDDDAICDNQPTARLRARDAATRKLLVEPEGFYKEKVETIFFCPKDMLNPWPSPPKMQTQSPRCSFAISSADSGALTVLISDQGSNLTSSRMEEVCQMLEVKRRVMTAYHPTSNGLIKRFSKTIVEIITRISDMDNCNWDTHLPASMFVYRNTVNSATGETPNFLIYNFDPHFPNGDKIRVKLNQNIESYRSDLVERLVHKIPHAVNDESKRMSQEYWNRHHSLRKFEIGELVW
ncbi:pregnancy zone protein-like [Centruroides sculpturatus]|uniref:pregnancy zone protein-like n=1 Tax=Centruroides sculpturatus TaxID=218467 RepID=UPI000C6CD102|nr:pregnancy zone protein-like [Centruroides sculpturatus]